MRRNVTLPLAAAALGALVVSGVFTAPAHACPFCSAPSLTLSETVANADAAVLAEWVAAVPTEGTRIGQTTFRVLDLLRGGSPYVEEDAEVVLARHRPGQQGDLFLLCGNVRNEQLEWNDPIAISDIAYQYVSRAPSPESPSTTERLRYFVGYLEHPDPLIAGDAYAEFANARYEDIVPLAPHFPREALREWLNDEEVPANRIGLYGMMLGLCGDQEDAEVLEAKIVEDRGEFTLGLDGCIGGYLLLTGEEGLELVEEHLLANPDARFGDTYAAMQALRFYWQYGEGIEHERLRGAMRLLLDRPNLADLVIADLARWADWSVVDRLIEMYGDEDYDIPSIRRAIVRYLMACSDAQATDRDPEAAQAAAEFLDVLRVVDARTVEEAERFFFVQ